MIDENGEQLGVMPTRKAIDIAREKELDLVEVSPNARPPVCKILDYGKYAYDLQKKMRESRKRSQHATVKEVQFRPKIGKHDYDFKMRNAVRFLKAGDRVRVVVRFRGRENAHPEVGEALLMRAADDVKEIAVIDQRPNRDGRVMVMLLAPNLATMENMKKEKEIAQAAEAESRDAKKLETRTQGGKAKEEEKEKEMESEIIDDSL